MARWRNRSTSLYLVPPSHIAARIKYTMALQPTCVENLVLDVTVIRWVAVAEIHISVTSYFEYPNQLASNLEFKVPITLYALALN
jgi:hypothetical protein